MVIRYELASLRERIMAFFLDQFAIWGVLFIMAFSSAILRLFDHPGLMWLPILLMMGFFFTYSLLLEILLDGQTPGKRMMGLKVVKLSGAAARPGDFALRWMLRLLDIWGSLGALGCLMIGTTPHAQRIGDLLAETLVIRLRPTQHVSLPSLLRMHETSAEAVVYARAGRFTEEDMLLAMEVLERVGRHPNPANRALLSTLCEKLRLELALSELPANPQRFVKQVIRDYVLLTR